MSATLRARREQPVVGAVDLKSTSSSAVSSVSASPEDTPTGSASSTSLSSLASSVEAVEGERESKKSVLRDTYGNQFEVPDFTIKEIRDAIPAHCYDRSAARGLAYVLRDVVCLGLTFTLFHNVVTEEHVPSLFARTILWSLYTVIQGLFGTGLWVLAHECGHQSFSPSKTLNDFVGWICHSALLVPYFSWKISHGKHHKATGNLERDMVFVPTTREKMAERHSIGLHEVSELMEETPIMTVAHLVGQQLVGWLKYLLTNTTGHNHHEKQSEGKGIGKVNSLRSGVNHFLPSSPLFDRKDEHLILLSDLGLAIVGSVLYYLGQRFGWQNMLVWYFLPYLWVNHWLVAITFLQHTDPSLPHYSNESWSFVKGAAATIDREFGFIGRKLFHGIIETHVLHHYVSTIPFYHADEATEAIRPVMGKHYRYNTAGGSIGFLKSLWTSARWCQWVEPCPDAKGQDSGVMFFRNTNGLGLPPARLGEQKQSVSMRPQIVM